MIKLKPTNIFDFYAPTSSIAKIADFGKSTNKLNTALATSAPIINTTIGLPNAGKKDNTWGYLLVGAAIITGIIAYHFYRKKEKEESENYIIVS